MQWPTLAADLCQVAAQQNDEDEDEPAAPAAVVDADSSSDEPAAADEAALVQAEVANSDLSDEEEGPSQHDRVLSAETLELPGRGNEGSDSDEDQRDSQVKGSWWGKAYQVLGRIEKLERKKVPMDVLAEMHFNGLIPEEYEGTFSLEDLQYLVEVVEEHFISFLRSSATKSDGFKFDWCIAHFHHGML